MTNNNSVNQMARQFLSLFFLVTLCVSGPVSAEEESTKQTSDTYDEKSMLQEAGDFFGAGAEGLADVISRIFKEHGQPNAYIKGTEGSGALVVGARFGEGTLHRKAGGSAPVFWSGPSIGFDAGGNLSKVFVLIYDLPGIDAIFQRFPAIDGSFYYVGGVGANYHQLDGIVLAPIRLGVGLRAGVNIGYMHYKREKSWNPF
jgi:hypothetical protein